MSGLGRASWNRLVIVDDGALNATNEKISDLEQRVSARKSTGNANDNILTPEWPASPYAMQSSRRTALRS